MPKKKAAAAPVRTQPDGPQCHTAVFYFDNQATVNVPADSAGNVVVSMGGKVHVEPRGKTTFDAAGAAGALKRGLKQLKWPMAVDRWY